MPLGKPKTNMAKYRASPERKAYMVKYNTSPKRKAYLAKRAADLGYQARRIDYNRKRKANMSRDMFDWLISYQGNACAICRHPLETPFADHCHDSGKPRGLLCRLCNVAEGILNKTGVTPTEWATRLEKYLSDPPANKYLGKP